MKLFFFVLFLLAFISLQAQPTWIRKLTYNTQNAYTSYDDTLLGVVKISTSLYGGTYIVAKDERAYQTVYKINSLGDNQLLARFQSMAGHYVDRIGAINSTLDSGCVFAENYDSYSAGNYGYAYIHKYNAAGQLQWMYQLPRVAPFGDSIQSVYSIADLPGHGYACLAIDSIYCLNAQGVLYKTLPFSGPGILRNFNNGDFCLHNDLFQGRIDTAGNIIWTLPGSQGVLFLADTSCFLLSTDSLFRINSLDGSIQSGVSFQDSSLYNHTFSGDGSWIAFWGNNIASYAADGSLKWYRHYYLPPNGWQAVNYFQNGTLLTGGSYYSTCTSNPSESDYSAFICTIDSNGTSVIDSTDLFYKGIIQQHNNQFIDYLYPAIAAGASGSPRDTTGMSNIHFYNACGLLDFATDWLESFPNGRNYKYSDVTGDGLIDTADIRFMTLNSCDYSIWDSAALNCQNNPFLSVKLDRDTLVSGDTLRAYIVLGTIQHPVDSISGISFVLCWNHLYQFLMYGGPINTYHLTGRPFGGVNDIYGYTKNWVTIESDPRPELGDGFLSASIDHHMAYAVAGDTVAFIDIVFPDSLLRNEEWHYSITSVLALTSNGTVVSLCAQDDSLYLSNPTLPVPALEAEHFLKMFPNPAHNVLHLNVDETQEWQLEIFDSKGMLIERSVNTTSDHTLNTNDYSPGLYWLRIQNENDCYIRKFIVLK